MKHIFVITHGDTDPQNNHQSLSDEGKKDIRETYKKIKEFLGDGAEITFYHALNRPSEQSVLVCQDEQDKYNNAEPIDSRTGSNIDSIIDMMKNAENPAEDATIFITNSENITKLGNIFGGFLIKNLPEPIKGAHGFMLDINADKWQDVNPPKTILQIENISGIISPKGIELIL